MTEIDKFGELENSRKNRFVREFVCPGCTNEFKVNVVSEDETIVKSVQNA